MGSEANRLRQKWQDKGLQEAINAENSFFKVFELFFANTEYVIRKKPNEFSTIYVNVRLSEKDMAEIYSPEKPITKHGIFPDYAIDNLRTKKTIYVEVKKQDGWVEGKSRSAGRGNAHERSCKFFTPGLLKILRQAGNIPDDILPFWVVFQGDITRDPCRVREITCWYEGSESHYFFWRNSNQTHTLIEHFIDKIQPLLD